MTSKTQSPVEVVMCVGGGGIICYKTKKVVFTKNLGGTTGRYGQQVGKRPSGLQMVLRALLIRSELPSGQCP